MAQTPDAAGIDKQLWEHARQAVAFLLIAPSNPSTKASKKSLSYFGGYPTLAEKLAWPRVDAGSERKNVPMTFLGQIDCAQLPSFDERGLLPDAGLLHFFECTDNADNIKGRVLFSSMEDGPPRERKPPADIHPIGYPYADFLHRIRTEQSIAESRKATIADASGLMFPTSYPKHQLEMVVLQTFSLAEICPAPHDKASAIAARPYLERLLALTQESFSSAFGSEPARNPGDPPIRKTHKYSAYAWHKQYALNQMLGFPCDDNGSVPNVEDVLLMQFRTDVDAFGCLFGDGDELQYWIKRSDLLARRFDTAWTMTPYG